jgi:phosphoserine phosphatase
MSAADVEGTVATAAGIAAFDLDGTLLRGMTACELIAAAIGRLPEMRAFESSLSRRALLRSRLEMARWYEGLTESQLCTALSGARWAPGAHQAVSALQAAGVEVAIASVTWGFAVAWFARELSIRHFMGTELSPSGAVTHAWPTTKGKWLRGLTRSLDLPRARAAAIGDSLGDLHLLRSAGVRVFVGSEPPALPHIVHLPDADLGHVAEHILNVWRL